MAVNEIVREISPATEPSDAELAELARLRNVFRRHRIFRDVTHARGVRYIAHGATIRVRPHTIITHDLAELHHELEQATLDELRSAVHSIATGRAPQPAHGHGAHRLLGRPASCPGR